MYRSIQSLVSSILLNPDTRTKHVATLADTMLRDTHETIRSTLTHAVAEVFSVPAVMNYKTLCWTIDTNHPNADYARRAARSLVSEVAHKAAIMRENARTTLKCNKP